MSSPVTQAPAGALRERVLDSTLAQAELSLETARARAIEWKYNRFAQVLDVVFTYCSENAKSLLLFNTNRVAAHVRGEPFYPDDPVKDLGVVILSQEPVKHAKAIVARILALTKYVSIMSFAFGKEQVISVENERLVQVHMLFEETLDKFTVEQNMSPMRAKLSWPMTSSYSSAKPVMCSLAPVALTWLISLRALYSPENIDDTSPVEEMFALANQLLAKAKRGGDAGDPPGGDVVGGRARHRSKDRQSGDQHGKHVVRVKVPNLPGGVSNSADRLSLIANEVTPIVHRLIAASQSIKHAGGRGVAIPGGVHTATCGRGVNGALHVVTPSSVDFAKLVIQALAHLGKGRYQLNRNFIMEDFRLKRVTVHIEPKGQRPIHVVSIFNSTDYEVVPATWGADTQGMPLLITHPIYELRTWLYSLVMHRFYTQANNSNMADVDWGWVADLLSRGIEASSPENIGGLVWTGSVRDEKIDKVKMGINVWRPRLADKS